MKDAPPEKLLVIIPITRTGEMPERAVTSLEPIARQILVVASFNRPLHPTADERLLQALRALNAHIIHPDRRLGPCEHAVFFLRECRKLHRLPRLQPTTILCDDDELLLAPEDARAIVASVAGRVAIWGQSQIVNPTSPIRYSPHAFYSSRNYAVSSGIQRHLDELEFARIGFEREPRIQGNLTGIFAPHEAFRSAFSLFAATRSRHGARIENTILGWRGLSIAEHHRPVARIHLHPGQSGSGLPGEAYRRSELRYRLHAVFNARSLGDLAILRRAGFGPRWFWRELTWALRGWLARRLTKREPARN